MFLTASVLNPPESSSLWQSWWSVAGLITAKLNYGHVAWSSSKLRRLLLTGVDDFPLIWRFLQVWFHLRDCILQRSSPGSLLIHRTYLGGDVRGIEASCIQKAAASCLPVSLLLISCWNERIAILFASLQWQRRASAWFIQAWYVFFQWCSLVSSSNYSRSKLPA